MSDKKILNRVCIFTIIGNMILTAFKMFAGFYGSSSAMISDSIHSLSDVLTTVIAWAAIVLSTKKADKSHPYGHERIECVASLMLGGVLLFVAISIGYSSVVKIIDGSYKNLPIPTMIALIASIVSIVSKEIMYHYTKYCAKKINSSALMADAWHHRSDSFSSIGALIGIGGAILGFPVMDTLASIVICLCILKVAYDIIKDALKKMLDSSCSEEYEKEITDFVCSYDEVLSLDLLKTRMFGNKVYIDLEIGVDGNLTLKKAHDIADKVHDGVEENFKNVKHIMIHINPKITS